MSVMIERLEGMVNRYHEITDLMMMPEITSDSKQLAKLGREQAELTQVVETYTEYKKTAESVLLICCPPAPLERIVSISRSFISISKSSASTSGVTRTVAVDV